MATSLGYFVVFVVSVERMQSIRDHRAFVRSTKKHAGRPDPDFQMTSMQLCGAPRAVFRTDPHRSIEELHPSEFPLEHRLPGEEQLGIGLVPVVYEHEHEAIDPGSPTDPIVRQPNRCIDGTHRRGPLAQGLHRGGMDGLASGGNDHVPDR
jgi:hypothetical protein